MFYIIPLSACNICTTCFERCGNGNRRGDVRGKERGDAIEITLKNVYLGPGLAPGEIYHMQPHAASCSLIEALRCFYSTGLDAMGFGDSILRKEV